MTIYNILENSCFKYFTFLMHFRSTKCSRKDLFLKNLFKTFEQYIYIFDIWCYLNIYHTTEVKSHFIIHIDFNWSQLHRLLMFSVLCHLFQKFRSSSISIQKSNVYSLLKQTWRRDFFRQCILPQDTVRPIHQIVHIQDLSKLWITLHWDSPMSKIHWITEHF